jgi:hypothetical protein
MVCASLLSSPPTCEVVLSSLPKSTGLSSFFITVEIANSDFSSEGEYISAVILGGQTLGNLISDLKYDGADTQCNKMSKILDLTEVPIDTVSSAGELIVRIDAGELIVRIEASLGVNANECDGSYLYARVKKLTTCTGRILLCGRELVCALHPQERARTRWATANDRKITMLVCLRDKSPESRQASESERGKEYAS